MKTLMNKLHNTGPSVETRRAPLMTSLVQDPVSLIIMSLCDLLFSQMGISEETRGDFQKQRKISRVKILCDLES